MIIVFHNSFSNNLFSWDSVYELTNIWNYNNFPSQTSIIKYSTYLNPLLCKGIYLNNTLIMIVISKLTLILHPILTRLGFVVIDSNCKKIKFKSSQYNALKSICWFSENINTVYTSMLEIISCNYCDDFLSRLSTPSLLILSYYPSDLLPYFFLIFQFYLFWY